jgi:multicomponent Na+:H+ antiporter subunit D
MTSSVPIDLAKVYVTAPAVADWLAIMPVALCLIAGAILTAIRRQIGLHAPLAIAALGLLAVIDAALLIRVLATGPLTMVMGRWLPPFGIAFSVDLAGALMAFVAAIVALAGSVFATRDIDRNGLRYGFYPLLMFLMAGVSGAFLTGDIFNLYVWFEVLLIASFGLLVLGGEREQIDAAVKYGLLNLIGTTLFLIATGYLYAIFGTLNMADIATKVANAGANAPVMTLATLYLAAFGMKAAAFPVNFWLPAAYHAPRITVSALFAGLLTKVGVYALFRVLVMLMPGARDVLAPLISVIAIVTMLTGALGAIAQSDLRRMLGQMVISGIGVMMAGLAIGGQEALGASLFYALHSMLVMTGLYFMAGLAGRRQGFDLRTLSGLYGTSPFLAALALMLLFSVSGLPPFSGFWPKAMLVKVALAGKNWWLAGAILLSGFLTTFAAGRVFLLAFWRPTPDGQTSFVPESDRGSIIVLSAIVLLTTIVGLWPEPLIAVTRTAANGLVTPAEYIRSVFPEPRP